MPLHFFFFSKLFFSFASSHAMQLSIAQQARCLRAGVFAPRAPSRAASAGPLTRRTEEQRPAAVAANASSSRIRPLHHHHRATRLPSPPRVNPFDLAWGTSLPSDIDPQQLAANLFASSIVPYAGFLFFLSRSRATPPLTLFGFYFLLAFVFGTIPAGIYAKVHYGKILADVDWLHGGAESLLTLTNLFVVLGLRRALREAEAGGAAAGEKKEEGSSSS